MLLQQPALLRAHADRPAGRLFPQHGGQMWAARFIVQNGPSGPCRTYGFKAARPDSTRSAATAAKLACWARSEGRWGRPGATRCKAAPPPLPQSPEVAATGDDGMHQRDRCRRRSRVTRFAPRAAASSMMVASGRVGLSGLGLSCSARQRSSMAMHCFIRRSSVAS